MGLTTFYPTIDNKKIAITPHISWIIPVAKDMIVLDNVTENMIMGSVIVTSAVLTSTLFNFVKRIITTI